MAGSDHDQGERPVSRERPATASPALVTPLDGQISVELRLPRGRLDTLELLSPDGKVVARGLWSGLSVRRLSYLDCGARRFTLRVTRAGNPGQFSLTVTRP